MREDEAFAGRSLVDYFGGPSSVSMSNGEDPPDLYLTIAKSRIAVEVTRLSQFTFEPNGILGNRATQDAFGVKTLNDLNVDVGPSLPDNVSLLIGLTVPVENARRFRKELKQWVKKVALIATEGFTEERDIDGEPVSISAIARRPSNKAIAGFVSNSNSSADISLNALLVLEERIRKKHEICVPLAQPLWLAMLNDYWLADARTYQLASQKIELNHCFERLFVISDSGVVSELAVGV